MRRRLQRIYWIGIVCTLTMAMIAVSLLVMFRIEDKSESLRSVLPPAAALILVGISMLLTVIAGLFPSRIAAKKDPVEALRNE